MKEKAMSSKNTSEETAGFTATDVIWDRQAVPSKISMMPKLEVFCAHLSKPLTEMEQN